MQLLALAAAADVTTANATIVLAVATDALVFLIGVYAWLTHQGNRTIERAADAAVRSAQSAAGAVSAAERSLLLAAMPLVLGYNFARHSDTNGYVLQLLNEGPTTAFNVEVTIAYPGLNVDRKDTLSAQDRLARQRRRQANQVARPHSQGRRPILCSGRIHRPVRTPLSNSMPLAPRRKLSSSRADVGPQSAGVDDAEWTFGWTEVGTRVIMIP